MKETRKIEVIPYNPAWVEQFEQEAAQIKKALEGICVAVHHIGSTSVPGLAAKPKIDIIAVVTTCPAEAIKKLEAIGFEHRGEYNIPLRRSFSKRGGVDVNLHVFQEGHPEIELNLTFRDYLRSHPEIRDEYAAMKLKLLEDKASFEKNNSMFTGYNLGKDAFIRRVLKLAGFRRLRFVKCTHYAEWEAAKRLCQHEWDFNHQDHVHFVLCRGVDVIGYADIERTSPQAAIKMFVVEEAERGQQSEKQFLAWIEAWLQEQDKENLC